MTEKVSWIDRVKKEVLHGGKEERNILHTREGMKPNWLRYI